MVSASDFDTLVIVLVFGVIGVIVAMLCRTLYVREIILDEFITGTITITEFMTGVIILFLVIGVVVAAVKK